VVLQAGAALDEALQERLRHAIATRASARHLPDEIHAVPGIPRTLSGKKMELPVKRLLLGAAPDTVLRRDAIADASAIDWFLGRASNWGAGAPTV
jgi:acetoacetyl-CoA synthetase